MWSLRPACKEVLLLLTICLKSSLSLSFTNLNREMLQCWSFCISFALKMTFSGVDLGHISLHGNFIIPYIVYNIPILKIFCFITFSSFFALSQTLYFNLCLGAYVFINSIILFVFITSESWSFFYHSFSKVLEVRIFWELVYYLYSGITFNFVKVVLLFL